MINLKIICTQMNKLKITNMLNLHQTISCKLNGEILKNYPEITKLSISLPHDIDFIAKMTKLKVLKIDDGFNDDHIAPICINHYCTD